MKIALIAKFRSGPLYEMMQVKGWKQSDFARAVGVGPTTVSRWCQMKDHPRTPAMRARVEEATGYLIEDLFPEDVQAVEASTMPRTVTVIRDMPAHRLATQLRRLLQSAEDIVVAQEQQEVLARVLGSLSARERDVLQARCGFDGEPELAATIGKRYGLSRTRIFQIEAEALRKLRNRWTRNGLREVMPWP